MKIIVSTSRFFLCGFVFFLLCPLSGLQAAEPELLGRFKDWSAYRLNEGGGKICYMVSKPIKAEGNYTRRGDIFALVTHRPKDRSKDVFSYMTGYTYKTGAEVKVSIDRQEFLLFTQDDTAWTPDAETDRRLAQAIQKGSKMVVKGTSSRGTLTTDTFSLSGSGAAYKEISGVCGY